MKNKKLFDEKRTKERESELIINEVIKDYERRKEERRSIEAQWTLNACFMAGRQFMRINPVMEVVDTLPDYAWQERQAYNHIAPIIETRLAKLSSVRPVMCVRPASNSDEDLKVAEASTKILSAVTNKLDSDKVISRATLWSEITGTGFYKVLWDGDSEDVKIVAVSPYEIYPDCLTAAGMEEVRSIIHARAVPISEIRERYGIEVEPEKIEILLPEKSAMNELSDLHIVRRDDCAMLIERYSLATQDLPDGELVIVGGGKLLHKGCLPYKNGDNGRRVLPFAMQTALDISGSFFGTSMIERIIPLQRAYNAVKNRKHEFMNRVCAGVMAVEDGAVDIDDLEANGLEPGRVIVYRQGSQPPKMIDQGSVPAIFSNEETRLETEFNTITGVSDVMQSSVPSQVTSGTAIQLLIDQDDSRLNITADSVRCAIRDVSKMTLHLYKQFASNQHLTRCVGEDGEIQLLKWNASDIGSCDVVYDTVAESANSRSGKQSRLLELLNLGLLNDEDGKLGVATRHKILAVLGYGSWETAAELQSLHEEKADKENVDCLSGKAITPDEIDCHEIHERAHIRYMLSGEFEEAAKKRGSIKQAMLEHIRAHRLFASLEKSVGENANEKPQE